MEREDQQGAPAAGAAAPLSDFGQAAHTVLTHLAATLPLRSWVLARVDGDEVLVLAAAGDGAAAARGSAFPWSGSVSAGMLDSGVRAALSLADVPGVRDAVAVRDGRVGAYLGFPICRPDGTLWGVLAGVAHRSLAVDLDEHVPAVELFARLLGGILAAGLRAAAGDREQDRCRITEMHDPVTGLGDRDFWDRVLGAEESRCRRYGDTAAIVVLELDDYMRAALEQGDGAAQVLLRRAARVLRTECREEDLVARVAPDTFAVLSVGADAVGAVALVDRLRARLEENAVSATLRCKTRDPRDGLVDAFATIEHAAPVEELRLA